MILIMIIYDGKYGFSYLEFYKFAKKFPQIQKNYFSIDA
jgi:hypothetical protein